MRNIDLKFDTFQLTVLQEPFLQFMHFSSFQFPFCLDISLVTGIFDAWYNAFRVRYFLILLFENFSSVHTIHSVIHIKNLSITIISSPSLKPHILQILSLTISLHLASPLLSPRHMHTVSCIFCYTHRWTGLFSVEPIYTPCWFHKCLLKIQTLLFLKKKKKPWRPLTFRFCHPLLSSAWDTNFLAWYSSQYKLLTYHKALSSPSFTHTHSLYPMLIFQIGQSILSWDFSLKIGFVEFFFFFYTFVLPTPSHTFKSTLTHIPL